MKIYFDDRPLQIIKAIPGLSDKDDHNEGFKVYQLPDESLFGSIIQEMQQDKQLKVKIYAADKHKTLQQIQSRFTMMQAGGGLVTTDEEKLMLIYRKGKWDLPKGKRDPGEDLATCAVREVEEETGVKNLTLKNLLHVTYHTYTEKQTHILKETHWYHMTTSMQHLTAQAEEGIEKCIWVDDNDLSNFTRSMHASVHEVLVKAAITGIITAVI